MQPRIPEDDIVESQDFSFQSPHIDREIADPVITFLKRSWKVLSVIVLAAFATMYVRDAVSRSRLEAARQGGDVFNRTRMAYESYQKSSKEAADARAATSDPKVTDEAEKKKRAEALIAAEKKVAEERSKLDQIVLALGDARAPYNQFARMYQGLLAREDGNLEGMKAAWTGISTADLQNASSSERLFGEVALLSYGRALLDIPGQEDAGRAVLADLADSGTIAATSAVLALSRVALTPEQRAQAKTKLEAVQARLPESAVQLASELARY